MNHSLQKYFKNKIFFVLSPHLDDAILSAGSLLYSLRGKANINVINVFTKAHAGPYTFSAKKYLKSTGFINAEELYMSREKEDLRAMSQINAKSTNLGIVDGIFRKKKNKIFLDSIVPELGHIYPTYRFHVSKSVSKDDYAPSQLINRLKKIINQDALVLVPLGVGNHVDHVIVRKVCEKLFSNIIYYADFPYSLKFNKYKLPIGYKSVTLDANIKLKSQMIMQYMSQFGSLFNKGVIPEHKEEFFVKRL